MRYQYKVVTARDAESFETLLNSLGAHGWKLGDFDIRTTKTGTFFAAVLTKGGFNS